MATKSKAKKLSGQRKVELALAAGRTLTPKQITAWYGLKNPHQQVFYIEDVLGVKVHREYTQTKKGFKTVKYSIGG